MKKKIKNLGDLAIVFNSLPVSEFHKPAALMGVDEPGLQITELVITEEDLLQSKTNPDDMGMESELRSVHGESFLRANYTVLEPAGKIYFYADKV